MKKIIVLFTILFVACHAFGMLQDAKYATIVKIKDEKGNILKHSKRAEPYNPIER